MNSMDITNGTLVANTASPITHAADTAVFSVTNLDLTTGATIWVRHDGTAATVAGARCKPVLPGSTVEFPRRKSRDPAGFTVSLISSGAAPYSVEFP